MSGTAPGATEPRAPRADHVQVWSVDLVCPPEVTASLGATLTADEHARAERYRFERDRRRYVVARAALRSILGRCLGLDPARVVFSYSAAGKPELDSTAASVADGGGQTVAGASGGTAVRASASSSAALRFNVSHAHERALVAVGVGRRIGVDVEWIRPLEHLDGMARRFFAEGERDDLDSLSGAQRLEAFYTCWTRKEAYLKGTGEGIAAPLDRFRVALLPGEPARLLETVDDPAEADRWRLADVPCPDGYVGALAVEGHDWRLVHQSWSP